MDRVFLACLFSHLMVFLLRKLSVLSELIYRLIKLATYIARISSNFCKGMRAMSLFGPLLCGIAIIVDFKTPNLTYKRIFLFWLPLESTWLMMAMEGALMSAIIARMAAPKFNLAAFGVAFSFLLILEAPLMMIISATTALVIDREAFIKMRRFTFVLIGIITLLMGITALPAVFYFLSQKLIGLPDHIARLTYGTVLISIPIPWAIGYRRFYQGVLIRHDQTRYVALGTAVRFIGITSLGLLLYRFSIFEGAWTGAIILLFAVTLEAYFEPLHGPRYYSSPAVGNRD